MDSSYLFTALITLAGSGSVAAIVTAWSQRGNFDASETKSKADAAKTISDTAAKRVTEVERTLDKMKEVLRNYQIWGRQVQKKCKEANIEIDDPPDLWLSY